MTIHFSFEKWWHSPIGQCFRCINLYISAGVTKEFLLIFYRYKGVQYGCYITVLLLFGVFAFLAVSNVHSCCSEIDFYFF